jgi:hypothetical protein
MSGIFQTIGAAWGRAAQVVVARPLPFAIAALMLAATDFLLWQIGAFDGVKAGDPDRGLLALFLVGKLLIILAWLLSSFRLAADPATPSLLRLSKRQGLWIMCLFLIMPLALAARMVLTKGAGLALAPLAPDPRTISLLGIALYLMAFMYFQMRLFPGLVGVLLGDKEASLRWSWRAMKGRVLASVAVIIGTMLPLFAIHFGNSVYWLPEGATARAIVLLFDGAIMAFLMLSSSAAYVSIYRGAKARVGEVAAGGTPVAA